MSDCQKRCYWNYKGQCYNGEEELNKIKPNSSNCPIYVRSDLEEYMRDTYNNIIELIRYRDYKELEAIEDFILGQRLEK